MNMHSAKSNKSFRQHVLDIVAAIPRGQTRTYKQVAAAAGSPNAARAVGTIMKSNYDPKIPCHRVIRSDGKPGEYNRGGPAAKTKILLNEGARI